MTLRQIFFLSFSVQADLPIIEVKDIFEKSVENNIRADVGGIMIYLDGSFIAVIEGEESKVLETFSRIKADARHGGIIVLIDEEIESKSFKNFHVLLKKSVKAKIMNDSKYPQFLLENNIDKACANNQSIAIKLLKSFL